MGINTYRGTLIRARRVSLLTGFINGAYITVLTYYYIGVNLDHIMAMGPVDCDIELFDISDQ